MLFAKKKKMTPAKRHLRFLSLSPLEYPIAVHQTLGGRRMGKSTGMYRICHLLVGIPRVVSSCMGVYIFMYDVHPSHCKDMPEPATVILDPKAEL
jgi:hypothetical protein